MRKVKIQNIEGFKQAQQEHQEKSRTASEKCLKED